LVRRLPAFHLERKELAHRLTPVVEDPENYLLQFGRSRRHFSPQCTQSTQRHPEAWAPEVSSPDPLKLMRRITWNASSSPHPFSVCSERSVVNCRSPCALSALWSIAVLRVLCVLCG